MSITMTTTTPSSQAVTSPIGPQYTPDRDVTYTQLLPPGANFGQPVYPFDHSSPIPTNQMTTRQFSHAHAPPVTAYHQPIFQSQQTPVTDQHRPQWVDQLFNKIDGIDAKFDKVCKRVDSLEAERTSLRNELRSMYEDVRYLSHALHEANDRLCDLDDRGRRNNLVFTNIPEQKNENTEEIITNLIQEKLGIKDVKIERCHRIYQSNPDQNSRNKPNTIVAAFSSYKTKEEIRKNANKLKGTKIGINEQYGKATNNKRKLLFPKYHDARKNGQYAKIVKDYLIINDRKFYVNQRNEVVQDTRYNRPPPPRRNPAPGTHTANAAPGRTTHTANAAPGTHTGNAGTNYQAPPSLPPDTSSLQQWPGLSSGQHTNINSTHL